MQKVLAISKIVRIAYQDLTGLQAYLLTGEFFQHFLAARTTIRRWAFSKHRVAAKCNVLKCISVCG